MSAVPVVALASVRPAALADVPALGALMAPYIATGDLLPRSEYDLCRHLKEYVLAQAPDGSVIGCGALKLYSPVLAEVFALTRQPLFFLRLGFVPTDKAHFPLKVWADCSRCPRREACDEVAVGLRLSDGCVPHF